MVSFYFPNPNKYIPITINKIPIYPVKANSSLKNMYPTPIVTKKFIPVRIGITNENLSNDNAFIEKNIEINIKNIAKTILKSNKNIINSLKFAILPINNLFLIIAAPATLKMAYKTEKM